MYLCLSTSGNLHLPIHKAVKVIGHPLCSLGICAFFSRLGSRSSTVHLHIGQGIKRRLGRKETISNRKGSQRIWRRLAHLYPLDSRCRNTNIVTFAMFIPKQVLGPDPKGM